MRISLTELFQIIDDRAELVALREQIRDLLAGDAATFEKAKAAFDKSENIEAKMRAAVPPNQPGGD